MNFFFFFNDTATTEIYTLSLHDALPIFALESALWCRYCAATTDEGAPISLDDPNAARLTPAARAAKEDPGDRKSTRLNSSHANISYAVFCLKKKKNKTKEVYSGEYVNYN